MATYNLLQQDLPVFSGISTSFGAITASIGEVFSYMWLLGIVACLLAGAAIVAIGGLRLTAADSGNKAREIKEDMCAVPTKRYPYYTKGCGSSVNGTARGVKPQRLGTFVRRSPEKHGYCSSRCMGCNSGTMTIEMYHGVTFFFELVRSASNTS
jgi:hypothetical protein